MIDGGRARRSKRASKNPRALAARVLAQVLRGRSLAVLLSGLPGGLPAAERALAKELCFGTARWWFRLDPVADRLLERPLKAKDADLRALILVGLYQLAHARVADHAAVAETVEAARALDKPWAAGLVNAVLRAFQRRREGLLAEVDRDPATRFALPGWLLERFRAAWPDAWEHIAEAGNERPPMSLRVNLARLCRADYLHMLAAAGMPAEPIEATDGGVTLAAAVDAWELPGFEAGLVSVQDGAAQLAAPLLDLRPGCRVLDACAAPGGKSCHILESAPEGTRLVALDKDEKRLALVFGNLERLGLRAEVVAGDAGRPDGAWATAPFDRILLDAPCSATGVIRRHPDIKLLRRPGDMAALRRTQAAMLDALWGRLVPGGRLVYATCSILPEENEEQVAAFLRRQPSARELPIDGHWGEPRPRGRQLLPGDGGMDGFYYAVLGKAL